MYTYDRSLCCNSSPGPVDRHVEGSEFKENEDSTKLGLVSGLNGKSSQWSFEGLIDINGHSNSRPLIEAEDCSQVAINCDGSSDGSKVTYEESTLHSTAQPIEALSGEERTASPVFTLQCYVSG